MKKLNFNFGNPRVTQKERQEIEEMKKSINQFGIWRGIVIDENYSIIAGNKLAKAVKELNLQVPILCIKLNGYTEKVKNAIFENEIYLNDYSNEIKFWYQN